MIFWQLLATAVLFVCGNNVFAASDGPHDVQERLTQMDARFRNEGPSLDLLNGYDSIIGDINDERILAGILYKHGIINIALHREKLAISDFAKCKKLHNGCQKHYCELTLKFGDINELIKEGNKCDNWKLEIEKYKIASNALNSALIDENWGKCIEVCDIIESISERDDFGIRNKIKCLKKMLNNSNNIDINDIIDNIINEYEKLLTQEVKHIELNDYVNGGEMAIFAIGYGNGKLDCDKILRNCLRIDNDYEGCKNLNRINLKLKNLFHLITEVSNYYSYIYSESSESIDESRIADVELSIEQWRQLNSMLFNSKNKIIAKNSLDLIAFKKYGIDVNKLKNNYEIIIKLYENIINIGKNKEKTKFWIDFQRMARQSFLEIGETDKIPRILKKKIKRIDNDLVDYLIEIDTFLKRKEYSKARNIIENMSRGLRLSRAVREREQLLKEAQHREHQRHRQQQQQQQQQQWQWQQQQQQQQQQQRTSPAPDTSVDYYKVLGVGKKADEAEIKKAYRAKMREHHPDKVAAEEAEAAEAKVAEINNAYEVLSDPDARAAYDAERERPIHGRQTNPGQQQYQQYQQYRPQGGQSDSGKKFNFNFGGFDFGGFGFGKDRGRGNEKGKGKGNGNGRGNGRGRGKEKGKMRGNKRKAS